MLSNSIDITITFTKNEEGYTVSNPITNKVDTYHLFDLHYTTEVVTNNRGLGFSLVKDFCEQNKHKIKCSTSNSQINYHIYPEG